MHCAVYHFVLRRISHCHTNTRTQIPLVSPGNLSTVSVKSGEKKRKSGTDGIKMIETAYNGSHKFPYPSPRTLPHLLTTFFFSLPSSGFSHRCLFNAILAHSLCQRGSGSLEAPWSDTKSAKRRKREGREDKEEKKGGGEHRGSRVIFSPSQINWKISGCNTLNYFPHAQVSSAQRNAHAYDPLLLKESLPSFQTISLHSSLSHFSRHPPLRHTSAKACPLARCQSCKWDS